MHEVHSLVMLWEDENSSSALLKTDWQIWKDQQNSSLKKLSFSLYLYFVSPLCKSMVIVIPFLKWSLFGHCMYFYLFKTPWLVFCISYLTIFMTSRPETGMNTSLIVLTKMTCPSTILISKLTVKFHSRINCYSPKLMNAMPSFTHRQMS